MIDLMDRKFIQSAGKKALLCLLKIKSRKKIEFFCLSILSLCISEDNAFDMSASIFLASLFLLFFYFIIFLCFFLSQKKNIFQHLISQLSTEKSELILLSFFIYFHFTKLFSIRSLKLSYK